MSIESLVASPDLVIETHNARLDSATGRYTAELRLKNLGKAVGRMAAVVLRDLPAGVTLVNASGVDTNGDPYLNLSTAIRSGGLGANAVSQMVLLELDNPNAEQFRLVAEVLVSGPNTAPEFVAVEPLTVTPGATLTVPLSATDVDGDRVAFLVDTSLPLPNITLFPDRLVIEPTPEQIGTYQLRLIAGDGSTSTTQTVTLDVVADPIRMTRISGVIQNTDAAALEGVVVQLGRFQTLTDADGAFTLTIPSFIAPTEAFDIPVPADDPQFDPFGDGMQTIGLFRAGFDPATGTDTENPRQHPNLITSFLDASVVYGSDAARATALRTLDGTGRLKTSDGGVVGALLPRNDLATFPDGMLENENNGQHDPADLFAAGDVRANDNVQLLALHTLMVREHNRRADELAAADPTMTGDELYEAARRWVGALLQQITYNEFLPVLLGEGAIPQYAGYDPSVDPRISGVFSGAAFRI
ncbi:MAG: hypothetical protein KDA71_20125, partial [Planctomycetales bacterium]|nr:hypothetical protein [Planctomycetales bacterium]